MRTIYLALVVLVGATFAPGGASAQTMCTMEYAPVCAAQEVQCIKAPCYPIYHTYGNACMANAGGARIIHEGECTPAESGPVIPEEQEVYTPPANCTAWNDGCNSCSRSADGQAVCTLRFCEKPGAGYCTAYEDGVAPTTTPDMILPWWEVFATMCASWFGWLRF